MRGISVSGSGAEDGQVHPIWYASKGADSNRGTLLELSIAAITLAGLIPAQATRIGADGRDVMRPTGGVE
jgi:hypothetical protein